MAQLGGVCELSDSRSPSLSVDVKRLAGSWIHIEALAKQPSRRVPAMILFSCTDESLSFPDVELFVLSVSG